MYTNISNKIEQLSYKDEYAHVGIRILMCLKEELAWAIDKWLHIKTCVKSAIHYQ